MRVIWRKPVLAFAYAVPSMFSLTALANSVNLLIYCKEFAVALVAMFVDNDNKASYSGVNCEVE